MLKSHNIKLFVNGKKFSACIESRLLLSDFLRYELKLTGTHVGCDTSQCGSCIVSLDGKCVKSCNVLVIQCDNKKVITVEGLGKKNELHKIQKSFKENHGLQCGFCTPGILFTAIELENNIESPTEKQIRKFLDGNLCRCTGYQNIVKSIQHYMESKRNNV